MTIKVEKFIQAHETNYTKGGITPKYVIMHYVGALGGAEANLKYFSGPNRKASAHYFVDHGPKALIYQSVKEEDRAWHSGTRVRYIHPNARNVNSLGIEMCCKKDSRGQWYIEKETQQSAVELAAFLLNKYNLPIKNLLRHYDITEKICPEPFVRDIAQWNNFKKRVQKEMDLLEGTTEQAEIKQYRSNIEKKIGLQKETLDYLEGYTYGKALLRKISEGLR